MKAIQLIKYGDAVEGVELRDVPEPAGPGPGEALVAVEFAPININDLMVVWGIYDWKPEPPITIGNEGSGRVLAVGSGVETIKAGDRVVLPFMSRTWRERLVLPAEQLVAAPPDADPRQLAMMAINAATVAMLLSDFVDLQAGDAIAYNLATSGLGQWIAALAGGRGLRTVGLVRRREDVDKVRAGGCEVVIAEDEEMAEADAKVVGLNIRLALDGVSGPSAGRLVHLLGPKGKLVSYGAVSRTSMQLHSGDLIFKQVTVHGFFEGHPHNASRVVPILRDLVGLIGPGGVRQPVTAVYPIDRAKDAVAHAVRGGKILLAMST